MLGSEAEPVGEADHPALAWRRAGLLAITGEPEGPGLVCPAALAAAADGALMALRALAPDPAVLPANGAILLGERARLMGLVRHGRISANRSCRLLDALDGRIALNLARADDWDVIPALLGCDAVDGWADIERKVASIPARHLIELGIELGLPIALEAMLEPELPLAGARHNSASDNHAGAPLVLDFASLWAGPLAASLLGMMGADVIKIESVHRPDGARRGHSGFHDLLNCGKRCVALDFGEASQLSRLLALVARADIIIEGSRPRALRRLGVDRDAFVAGGGMWISITGHGDPERVGFGDDAAIAAGLSACMQQHWGEAMFAGDAIADPLTGLHAALAAWAAWRHRRSGIIPLSLAGTTAFAMQAGLASGAELEDWQAAASADRAPLYALRKPAGSARPSGADNSALLGL
jgi:crotonobetainyl-CoA:carnitine CoA-transferase CaiB-like acyl-CoA transferase